MRRAFVHIGVVAAVLVLLLVTVSMWLGAASRRAEEAGLARASTAETSEGAVAVASAADVGYCSPPLKAILRRVLTACGLVSGGAQRGCQPLEARRVAAMSGEDFNALFVPLAERAAILQFERDEAVLDESARGLLDRTFSDQGGASYFLVVSRASPEGSVEHNRELSEARASAVLDHLKTTFNDPDLDQEVGSLWLGEEFAQLNDAFCAWNRSQPDAECSEATLNRSAFVAWIDCRL